MKLRTYLSIILRSINIYVFSEQKCIKKLKIEFVSSSLVISLTVSLYVPYI